MNHQLEVAASRERHSAEVAQIAGGQPIHAQFLGESDHRCIDEAEAEISVPAVDIHCTLQEVQGGWGVRERSTRKVAHESAHHAPFLAKEVVYLGKH